MAHNINRIAESLFEKIRARFEKVSIADSSAKTTLDPSKARYLNFNFVDKEGATFGNVEISIADEESIKITYGKNITADLDDDQKEEWYRFLADMKNFAVRNRLKFTPHDISRSLTLGDRKQQATTAGPVSAVDAAIDESKLYGTTKTSYEKINPNTRLIIRHSGPALPYVQRAYQEMKNRPAVESHLEEFEENLEKIAEGSWALPDDELKVKKLQELMADVLPAGVDGSNATGALYDVIGDDELFDKIHDASTGSPDTDVRPIIYDWLQANMPDVFEKVKANMESGGIDQNKPAPEEPTDTNAQPAEEEPTDPNEQPADEPAPQEQPQESADPLNDMRRLAGLRKN